MTLLAMPTFQCSSTPSPRGGGERLHPAAAPAAAPRARACTPPRLPAARSLRARPPCARPPLQPPPRTHAHTHTQWLPMPPPPPPPTHPPLAPPPPLPRRRIAVVSSDFHMPRTQATFDFCYSLAGEQLQGDPAWFSLHYHAVRWVGWERG